MKRLLLAATMLAIVTGAANAAIATFGDYVMFYSGITGVNTNQVFGHVKVTDNGDGSAHVEYNVSPNIIINAGGTGDDPHTPLTFNLLSGETIINLHPS